MSDDQERIIGELLGRVNALEEWQTKQNGALIRMADKVDGLKSWMLGIAGGIAVQLFFYLLQTLKTQ